MLMQISKRILIPACLTNVVNVSILFNNLSAIKIEYATELTFYFNVILLIRNP